MPSRNTQLTFAWILIAFLMLGVAAWQVQTTLAKDAAARNAPLPPPLKTRHAIRPAAITFSGDPVADYIARCKKGITDQEILWIIEDFRNAELDVEWRNPELPAEQVLQLISRQQKWYLESIKDGLRLDPEQTRKAEENLQKLFQTAANEFIAERKKNAASEFAPIPTGREEHELAWLPGNPMNSAAASDSSKLWKLCGLSPEQDLITWKRWYQSLEKDPTLFFGEGVTSRKDLQLTEESYFRFATPFGGLSLESSTTPPDWARLPNWVLPILDQQNLIAPSPEEGPFGEPPNTETLLSNIRRLHPAQFKLLLLFAPEMAAEISKELQAPPR